MHRYAFVNQMIETRLLSIPLDMFAENFVIQANFACILKLAKLFHVKLCGLIVWTHSILVPLRLASFFLNN
ncbi:hypothetical protein NC653_021615 [Populus alba x Populus x berolinensis]|uniref:Uncharacterized protein n=1 Tax=Populus alba x Populus x berolinensis TaxID=444605 RepID=A0AAD6QER3_9ROSI|nr:hypothetical protein NC653_021615 [Populus alba x Populus x berolinensis]